MWAGARHTIDAFEVPDTRALLAGASRPRHNEALPLPRDNHFMDRGQPSLHRGDAVVALEVRVDARAYARDHAGGLRVHDACGVRKGY